MSVGPIIEQIYFKSPVWIQNVLVSAYGCKLWNERYSGKHNYYLQELFKSVMYTKDEIRELQRREFLRIIDHVFKNVPFYQTYAKKNKVSSRDFKSLEDIHLLPIIEKEMIRNEPLKFCAQNYLNKKYVLLKTSGSTGKPLSIYCDLDSRRKHYAFWSRLRTLYKLSSISKRATFFGKIIQMPLNNKKPFWRYDIAQKNMLFSSYHLSDANLIYYCQKLAEYQPEEILAYPSSIFTVARYILEKGISSIRPKVIFTTAETLTEAQREIIEKAFSAPVVNQFGSVEMVIFAHQCNHQIFHVHAEHGYHELYKNEYGEEELVCTGFVNYMMPLIRYRLGDLVTVTGRKCEHMGNMPNLGEIIGRRDDVIKTPSGKYVGRLNTLLCGVAGVCESQIVQKSLDVLDILIVIDGKFTSQSYAILEYELKKRIGPEMCLNIKVVESISKGPNGKFKHVVKEI